MPIKLDAFLFCRYSMKAGFNPASSARKAPEAVMKPSKAIEDINVLTVIR